MLLVLAVSVLNMEAHSQTHCQKINTALHEPDPHTGTPLPAQSRLDHYSVHLDKFTMHL